MFKLLAVYFAARNLVNKVKSNEPAQVELEVLVRTVESVNMEINDVGEF